ncbi:26S proteasome non-ATPase regulatory subunit 12 [Theileria orientalis strain Shintoku]|uniref:26S proteasome non-ATPase regulatory subunit 12 n=1 Tax=Theileria orientalis strain Shintoku TaxID=869250 RepID=J4CD53_THEOR|nr:26S proteasome non-ATPase regulatory subunit 12 [Theileria orientalis strain Shintoku]BAM40542.1 26S proteasome non-ATPase regulatory subunit 12 [Theileria orientalis strain Shintoku]|eukprot:XP_009690843.1 26S proteasome non-ATPase regulatory subunit 12 [Theileria orientalis strain Shintoku]
MFEEDDFGIIDRDSYLKDPPPTEDLSELADSTIEKAKSSLTDKYDEEKLKEVLFDLMMAEKKCRQNLDGESNKKICCFIIEVLYKYGDFPNLNYYLTLLSRKRGQLKVAISGMVALAKGWLKELQDKEVKAGLFETLNSMTLGKIYLEDQRAELVFSEAKNKEMEGKVSESLGLVQDLEVETFGCLSKMEKVRYILEQMRLNLMVGDYIRFFIASRKINEKLLDGDDFFEEKLRYYEYMVHYYKHEGSIFEVAQSHHKRYNALNRKLFYDREDRIEKDRIEKIKVVLERVLIYLIISPINDETRTYMKKVDEEEAKNLKKVVLMNEFFKQFLSDLLVPYPLSQELHSKVTSLLSMDELTMLNDRIVRHNLQVISKYYLKVTLPRLSELLGVNVQKLEEEISNLVYTNNIFAKIDRPAGIVKFGKRQQPEVVLNKWSNSIGK